MKLLLAVLVVVTACSNKKKQKRTGDAAPVIVVPQPVFDGGVGGTSSVEEKEPNDSSDVATPIALGATARGKIDPETDADDYRVEIPPNAKPGSLNVLTSLVDADLTVDIEDPSGAVIARSDRGGVRVREGVPNLGVTPGKYTIVVRKKIPPPPKKPKKPKPGEAPTPPPPPPPVSYEITATFLPGGTAGNAEHEPDDDRGTANDLIVGDTAQGFIGWTGDVDLWKLSVETLSSKNTIDVEVGAVEGVALTLEVADGVGNVLLSRKAPKGSPLVVKNLMPVVAAGAPPFHYVTIKGDKSNPETSYTLRVAGNPLENDIELEPNDVPDKAMAFPSDRKSVKGVWTAGDVDCFALAPAGDETSLDISLTMSEIDLSLEVVVDGKVIAKSEEKGKGTNEKLTAKVPANAAAVVRVRAASPDAPGDGTYELTVREP